MTFYLWVPEWGETREDARTVSGYDYDQAVRSWAKRRDSEDIVPDGDALELLIEEHISGNRLRYRVRAVSSVDLFFDSYLANEKTDSTERTNG